MLTWSQQLPCGSATRAMRLLAPARPRVPPSPSQLPAPLRPSWPPALLAPPPVASSRKAAAVSPAGAGCQGPLHSWHTTDWWARLSCRWWGSAASPSSSASCTASARVRAGLHGPSQTHRRRGHLTGRAAAPLGCLLCKDVMPYAPHAVGLRWWCGPCARMGEPTSRQWGISLTTPDLPQFCLLETLS